MAPDRVPHSPTLEGAEHEGDEEQAQRLLAVSKRARGPKADDGGGDGRAGEEDQEGAAAEPVSSSAAACSPSKQRRALSDAGPSASSMKLPWAEEFAAGEVWITTQVAIVVNPYGSAQGRVLLTSQSLYFHPDRHLLPLRQGEEAEGQGGKDEQPEGKEKGGGRGGGKGKGKGKGGGFAYQWKDKKWRCVRVSFVCLSDCLSWATAPPRCSSPHTTQYTQYTQAGPRDGGARPALPPSELRPGGVLLRRPRGLPRLPHAQGPRCVFFRA